MNKSIVITGCSSGFGLQASEVLARRGHRVYATMRGTEGKNAEVTRALRGVAAKEKLELHVVELDVTSTKSVDSAAARILAESGAPDVVINNAGQMFVGITEAFSDVELTDQLDINVVGVHRVNRAFLPAMRQKGNGLLMNISSIAGRLSLPFFGAYHASKWALEGYSMSMRAELATSGIDVVVVEPGPFTTALFPRSPHPADKDARGATYPAVVHQTFEGMGGAFENMFGDPNTPTDPALVVDCMVQLAEMKAGTRPFRTVVGVDFGVRERNAHAASHDATLAETMGLTAFTTLKSGTPS